MPMAEWLGHVIKGLGIGNNLDAQAVVTFSLIGLRAVCSVSIVLLDIQGPESYRCMHVKIAQGNEIVFS